MSRNTLKDRLRALLYRSFQIILALLVLPYLLIGIYSFQAIRPISTLMLADSVMMRPWQRSWVTLDDMAPTLVQSVMMSEDGRFCSHSGVDWQALNAVVDDALSGERTRGASTIPMQTMKNLFLWSQRSFLRKALEIPQALFADLVWSKRRMLEIYLNIVEWDPGIYGAEAAAQHYFNVSAARLSARQAALLAVTLPNPKQRNPAVPSPGLNRLANTIEARAQRSGAYIKCIYD